MKKQLLVACIALLTVFGNAQTQETPSVVHTKKTTVKAKVIDVNKKDREITVRGARGEHVLKASDEVRNFDQIRKGDTVRATYYQSVALSLAKEGEPIQEPAGANVVSVAAEGERPSGVAATTKNATVKVESIDRAAREVTLKGPRGRTMTVHVDEKVGDLSRIKEGDRLNASYTESLAIDIAKE